MNEYLSVIGYHGPTILLMVIMLGFVLQHITTPYPYIAVISWQIISHLINITIKNIVQAPRPDSDKDPNFSLLKPNLANFLTIHRNYGVPSGHAQSTISELIFIALYFKKPIITIFAILQTGLTCWQRYVARRHSVKQLFAGGAIGSVVGFSFYYIWVRTFLNK